MIDYIKNNKIFILILISIVLLTIFFKPVRIFLLIILLIILGIIILLLWPFIIEVGNLIIFGPILFTIHFIRRFIINPIKMLIFNNFVSRKLRQKRIKNAYLLINGNWKIEKPNDNPIYFSFKSDKKGEIIPYINPREFLPSIKSSWATVSVRNTFSEVINMWGANYISSPNCIPIFYKETFKYTDFPFSFVTPRKLQICFNMSINIIFKIYFSKLNSFSLKLYSIIESNRTFRPNGRCPKLKFINVMSDEHKISIVAKNLCSKIFDIIYSSELHADINAQDTVQFLAYSYCLCLFAKVGFSDDSRLLEKFHNSESVQIYLLNWLNMILSRGKEIEYYESGLNKITKSMIDKFPDIFHVYSDGVKEFLALTEEKMDLKKMGIEKIQHEFQLMAAASTVTRDITSILDENYGVDIKAFDKSIHDACINAAFEIAGIEKLPNN